MAQTYSHLVTVAESDYGRSYPSGKNFFDRPDHNWGLFAQTLTRDEVHLFRKSAKYHQVRATQEAIDLSIAKCDVPAVNPSSDEVLRKAINLTVIALGYIKNATPLTPKELWDFNLSTSPGLPYSKQGFKTKGDVLTSDPQIVIDRAFDLTEVPIDTYNDKQEFLPELDLERLKVRGVFATSLHHLLRERLVYGAQNKALIDHHAGRWIQYGMVKQYGGFNAAIAPLEKFGYRDESDVSGWDRTACLVFVYIIRNRLLGDIPMSLRAMRDYVSFHNVHAHVLLPNGLVVRRATGVNSGRTCTTSDNSIHHLLILNYMFARRGLALDIDVSYSSVVSHAIYRIYSDDKLGSVDLEYWQFSDPSEFMDYAIEVYSLFGMTIKKSASFFTNFFPGSRISPLHSFLGSYLFFHDGYDMYIPIPRLDAICSTVVYTGSSPLGEAEFFAKLVSLTQLTVGCKAVFAVLIKFVAWYYEQNPNWAPIFDEFLETQALSVDCPRTFSAITTGYESFDKEVVGFKPFIMSLSTMPKKTSPNKRPAQKKRHKPQVKPVRVTDNKGKVQAVFRVPHCAMDYFSSLAAPFETPTGVCIPAEIFPLPSQKIKNFLKGRFQAGTTGIGFIIVSPCITNNGTLISATTAASVGGPATQFNAFTGVQNLVLAQFPWDEVSRAAGNYQARVVSYGIRVKYIGKLMDRNGVVTSFEEPDHRNCFSLTTTPSTLDRLNSNPQSTLRRVGGDLWDSEVFYSGPVEPTEVDFTNSAFPLGQYISVIAVQGEPGDSYEFEYVQHSEVIGTLATGKSASHADPATFGKVLEASKAASMDGPLDSHKVPSFFQRFMDGARELGPAIVSGGKMVAAVLSAQIPTGLLEAASTQENLARAFRAFGGAQVPRIAGRPEPLMLGM